MLNLLSLFDSLDPPEPNEETRFSAIPISGYDRHRLGKDSNGMPVLLISSHSTASQSWSAPVVLEHLTVLHNVGCRIIRPDGTDETGHYTLVHCKSNDIGIHQYFLRVVGTIVVLLKNNYEPQDVTYAISKLVELFRAIAKPSQKSLQGLWAELFLMARVRNPALLVHSWHSTLEDRYDFSLGNQRVEVKSASGRTRQHYFSLEQLNPPEGTEVLVASLFVEKSHAGKSITELTEKIRSRLGNTKPELLLHLEQLIALTLGDTWQFALSEKFDDRLAKQSLSFFRVSDIPSVNSELPLEVSQVRFRSDLTQVNPIELSAYQTKGGLFEALMH